MPKTDPKACVICAKSSNHVCGKCKTMNYCSRDCQKQHWKLHKKTCGKPVFVDRNLEVGDKCTRCLETVEDDGHGNPVLMGCRVPHPEHLQQSCGSCYGGDGVTLALMCQACNYSYRRTGSGDAPISETRITQGPKWCFEGSHTLLPAERLGDRRVKKDLVVITANEDMQEEIDALDGNEEITVLRICSDGLYTEEYAPSLNIKLPNLIEFQLEDVSMDQIVLTPDLTPKVKIISMQNPTQCEDPDFVIECSELKRFSCHYWGPGNSDWVNTMLAHATKLESFDSYKLRVDYLMFASNKLDNIRLHRAECLEYLELYAPRLTMLNVQAAYDLDVIKFVDTHPVLSKKLPKNFRFNRELEVNTVNACLGGEARHAIEHHPRFYGGLDDDDSDDGFGGFGGGGNPMASMEAMFHQFHSGGGFY